MFEGMMLWRSSLARKARARANSRRFWLRCVQNQSSGIRFGPLRSRWRTNRSRTVQPGPQLSCGWNLVSKARPRCARRSNARKNFLRTSSPSARWIMSYWRSSRTIWNGTILRRRSAWDAARRSRGALRFRRRFAAPFGPETAGAARLSGRTEFAAPLVACWRSTIGFRERWAALARSRICGCYAVRTMTPSAVGCLEKGGYPQT